MNRKGDLTSAQIIMLIIAIIGFVIVLSALYLVNLGGYSDDEICKLSVLTRATSPKSVQAAIPLKCKANKICLTEGYFGGCEEQFAGEEDVKYVHLGGDITNKRRIIEETSADAMYDCWNMMGQGKLDLFANARTEFGLTRTESTCVICSRVAVDKEVDSKVLTDVDANGKVVGGVDINNYIKTKQIPGQSLTYLQAFTDRGVNSFASIKEGSGTLEADENLAAKVQEASRTSLSTDENREMAFVFMQTKPPRIEDVLKNLGVAGATVATGTFMSPVGKFASRVLFTPAGAAIAVGVAGTVIGYGAFNAYQGQLAAAGQCGSFSSTSEDIKEGCSIVQGLNYNLKEINELCRGGIQGEL